MAIMMNCAVDWTLDKFAEDMRSVKALPMRRGVYPAKNLTDGQRFCQYVKTEAKFFREKYAKENGIYCDNSYEYVGDAFAHRLGDMLFSDWYKDTYNQRPHFSAKYVSILCGLPVFQEVGFCGDGYKDMLNRDICRARAVREELEKMA